jgi:type I restriction enzyme S subunit
MALRKTETNHEPVNPPAAWTAVAFPNSIRDPRVGRANQVLSSEIKPVGRYPVIDQSQSFIAGFSDDEARVIRADLPLVIFGDHTRVVKFVDFPFILGADGTKVLKPREELFNARFFAYALQSLNIPSRGYNRHFTLLKERSLPRPELPEQRKIAWVLGLVQRAIVQQEQLLRLTTELKKTLLHHLFAHGLRNEPQKQTDFGLIPQSWETLSLTEVLSGELQNGAFARRHQFGSGYLFANVVDMYHQTHLNASRLERVRFDQSDIKQYFLNRGDVLIVRSSLKRDGIGQNCVVGDLPEPTIYDCHLIRVIVDKSKIVPEFLSAFWRSPSGKIDLIQRSKTVTMTTINQAGISGALVPIAPIADQRKIVAILAQTEAKEQVHRRKHTALSALFKTLLHELMTARIRVHDLDLPELEDAIKD